MAIKKLIVRGLLLGGGLLALVIGGKGVSG
jgi:hypothetical protein